LDKFIAQRRPGSAPAAPSKKHSLCQELQEELLRGLVPHLPPRGGPLRRRHDLVERRQSGAVVEPAHLPGGRAPDPDADVSDVRALGVHGRARADRARDLDIPGGIHLARKGDNFYVGQ
jgi:hypothetical protein